MVNGLVADGEGRHFHGETSRPENQAAAGHVAAKPTRKNHVLRSKLTEFHSWNMAMESPETSTTATPKVETEQLETDVSCFSPSACPEYQTTLMSSKTNWSENQSHLSQKEQADKMQGSNKNPEKQRGPKPKRFERYQEHGFGMEPKLEQGLGYNPDAIEVIVWRTTGGIRKQVHDPRD